MPEVKTCIAAVALSAWACSHSSPVPVAASEAGSPPSPLRIGVHVAAFKDRSAPLKIEAEPAEDALPPASDGATLRETIPEEVDEVLTLAARYDKSRSPDECDLLLVGIIQSAAEGHAEVDLRLVSCVTHVSVASTHAAVDYSIRRGALRPTSASLGKAWRDLSAQVPELQVRPKGRVTAIEGDDITVAVLGDQHASLGMPALAVRYAKPPADPASPGLLGGEQVLARLYVRDVTATGVHARIVGGNAAAPSIAIGDYILFK